MKRIYSFRKANACSGSVSAYQTSKKESRWKDELLIFKSAAIGTIDGSITFRDRKDMFDLVLPSFSDGVISQVDEYHLAKVERLTDECFRYCSAEHHRVADGNAIIPKKDIHLDLSEFVNSQFEDCDDIAVSFDVIFKDPGVLTGVVYKKGVPDLSLTSRGTKTVDNSIELHLMLKALKKVADEMYKPGERINLVVSFFYSAKDKDNSVKREPLYFGKGEPIRSISETYKVGCTDETAKDTKLKELLDQFVTGHDPSQMDEEKDCKGCPKYSICYYKPAPVHQVIEESSGGGSKMTPSEEQQAVIDATNGIFVVNAAAGSGKTATTVTRSVEIAMAELNDVVRRYESGEDIQLSETTYACNDSRA